MKLMRQNPEPQKHIKDYIMKTTLLFLSVFLTTSLFGQIPSYVPTAGLDAFYSFSNNSLDESGGSNHGTVNGATLTTDRFGSSNSAYYFDGVDDNFYINPFPQVSEQNTYTIFLAAKLLSTADGQSLCGVNRSGLSINTSGGVLQTTTAGLAGDTSIAPDTDWHVFAIRVDLTQSTDAARSLLLIDGHDKATGANDITSYSGTASSTTGTQDGFYLGARGAGGSDSAGPARFANMYLGEVLMFNYALTDIEVKNVNNYLANKWGL